MNDGMKSKSSANVRLSKVSANRSAGDKEGIKLRESLRQNSRAKSSFPRLSSSEQFVKKDINRINSSAFDDKKINTKNNISEEKKKELPNIVDRRRNKESGDDSKTTELLYNLDGITAQDLRNVLQSVKENPVQPFSFLGEILDDIKGDDHVPVETKKPTEIDMQLAALMRRVELNRNLLERTNQRVKDINFLTERSKIFAPKESFYDENTFFRMKEEGSIIPDQSTSSFEFKTVNSEYPGIEQLRQTMNLTIEMLDYIKQISKGDLQISDLPQNLKEHMKGSDLKGERIHL